LTTFADMKSVWLSRKFSHIYEASPNSNLAFFMQSLYVHTIGTLRSNSCFVGFPLLFAFTLYLFLAKHTSQPYVLQVTWLVLILFHGDLEVFTVSIAFMRSNPLNPSSESISHFVSVSPFVVVVVTFL